MFRRVNLMQIVFSLEVGGLENLVLNLVEKLNKNKYNISICSLSAKGKLEERFNALGIPVYHLPKKTGIDYSLYFRLAGLFREKKIDIIHTHNPAPWFYSVISGKLSGVKVAVHTEHSNIFSSQKKLILAEKFLSKLTDVIISDSEKVTRCLIEKQGIDEKRIKTVINGIDIEKFQKEIDVKAKKKELGINEGSMVVGNVARLEPVKDHLYLLDIFKSISNNSLKTDLVVVGDGSQSANLKKRAKELGIENKVHFLGTRSDIPEIIGIFDVFVLTSISEGLSLSLLEAMAGGKPVVATDVGGNPEVVVDGVTGFLLPLNNTEKMAEAIGSLLENKELSQRMGESGLKRVKEVFSLDKMVNEYENIYDSRLQKKGVR